MITSKHFLTKTNSNMKTGITKGEWKLSKDGKGVDIDGKLCITCWQVGVVDYERLEGETWLEMMNRLKEEIELKNETLPKVNALFIMDAYTTTNKCGLLPSELLKQRDELLGACKMAFDNLKNGESKTKYRLITCLNALEEAINNATLTNQ